MKEGLVQYERLSMSKISKAWTISPRKMARSRSAPCAPIVSWKLPAALREKLPALVKLEQNVANVRVRQAGTIGGNLCFAEPHADPGTLLMALGATMVAEKVFLQAGNRRQGVFCRCL